jgi:uncharacterized membrane protein YhhN
MKRDRLGRINILMLVGAMACLVCYDVFGGLWLKGLTSLWFVTLGGVNLWAARGLPRREKGFFLLIFLGLFFGMCADVLLAVAFFAGIGSFALGHILYLSAFFVLEKPRKQDLWFFLPLAVASMFVVVGTPWITIADPVLEKLLLGYAVIIAAMLAKALSNYRINPSRARLLMALGSLMFWFSDMALAVDMFGQSSRLTWILCSYVYWPAQNILAHSLYHKLWE